MKPFLTLKVHSSLYPPSCWSAGTTLATHGQVQNKPRPNQGVVVWGEPENGQMYTVRFVCQKPVRRRQPDPKVRNTDGPGASEGLLLYADSGRPLTRPAVLTFCCQNSPSNIIIKRSTQISHGRGKGCRRKQMQDLLRLLRPYLKVCCVKPRARRTKGKCAVWVH